MNARMPSGFVRPLVGLAQGIAVWFVHEMFVGVPTQGAMVRETLLMLALLVPPIVLIAHGHMRRTTLTAWVATAAVVVTGLATYGVWRSADIGPERGSGNAALVLFTAAALYVVHHLLEPADEARRAWPPYVAYVDGSWRHVFQLGLSLLFIAVLSSILYLAAALFRAIGLEALPEVLETSRLQYPLLGLAFGIAMSLTDVRPALIDGVRKVALLLFAWLLPVVVAFSGLFLALLLFTGLAPLWSTRHATTLLLSATALLVVLVNAAYQDGREPASVAPLVRWSARAGGLMLPILVLLASWAPWLRIGQHGLSPERVAGLATCTFAGTYAFGYAIAACGRGAWMHAVERVNVVAAIVGVVLMLSLSSPIADPARLASANQVQRLASGGTPVVQFDFSALRFDMGRFGRDALGSLERSADTGVASQARLTRRQTHYEPPGRSVGPAFAQARIRPEGAVLPAGFREQAWPDPSYTFGAAACLVSDSPCDLYVLDLDGDGQDDVVAIPPGNHGQPIVFMRAAGSWRQVGAYTGFSRQGSARDEVVAIPPLPLSDLRVDGARLRFIPDRKAVAPDAHPVAPSPPP